MQGAGHNFGVVTSLKYKIYDVPNRKECGSVWSHMVFVWDATKENVKKVFGVNQALLDGGKQPDGIMLYVLLTISAKPVIIQHVLWNGPLSTIGRHTQKYHQLSPLSVTSNEGTYPDFPSRIDVADDSIPYQLSSAIPGTGLLRFPVDTKTYNLDALAAMTAKFSDLVTSHPDFAGSFIVIEQYPSCVVRAMDETKSAIPWRHHNLLVAPALLYTSLNTSTTPPSHNRALDDLAVEMGDEMRRVLIDGAVGNGEHYSYVNYAYGGETNEELYGKKNLMRLRELKKMYDLKGNFGLYAPIDERRESDEP